MIKTTTDNYNIYFDDNYAIIEAFENAKVSKEEAESIIKIILDHYDGKPVTVISNRMNKYTLDTSFYSGKYVKKLKGIAIVSQHPEVRKSAELEQAQFDHSFTFFTNLEDAKNWADSF